MQMQTLIFFKLVHNLLPDAFYCVFLDQKVKIVISEMNWDVFFSKIWQPLINMQQLKKQVNVCFFFLYSPYSRVGLN